MDDLAVRSSQALDANEGWWRCGPGVAEERRGVAVEREDRSVVGWGVEVVTFRDLVESRIEPLAVFVV